MNYITRSQSTQENRKYWFTRCPAIFENQAYRRFLHYILTTPFKNEYGPGVVASQEVCAWAEDKLHQLALKEYAAEPFLEAFSTDVLELVVTDYSFTEKRARAVEPKYTLEDLEAIAREAKAIREAGPKVYFLSGKPVTTRSERKRLEALEADLILPDEGTVSAAVAEYMNSQGTVTISRVLEAHFEEAWDAASSLTNENAKDQEQRKLLCVYDTRKALYRPSRKGETDRIFEQVGLTTLAKPVRSPLFQDLVDMDLKSSQLAIGSTLWDVPSVAEFLSNGGDIWQSLGDHMGLDPLSLKPADRTLLKGKYKTSLYQTIFGKHRKQIEQKLNRDEVLSFFKPEFGTRFLKHPLVKDLLDARELVAQRIVKAGRGTTCTGRVIEIDQDLEPYWQQRRAYSIMAQQAQAVELVLMASVLPVFVGERRARIIAWMHDGICVAVSDPRDNAAWFGKCRLAVYHKARELGIPTHLEWTNRPS